MNNENYPNIEEYLQDVIDMNQINLFNLGTLKNLNQNQL